MDAEEVRTLTTEMRRKRTCVHQLTIKNTKLPCGREYGHIGAHANTLITPGYDGGERTLVRWCRADS